MSIDDRMGLYTCLTADQRAAFAHVALQELAGLVAYSLKNRSEPSYRAWQSLSRESKTHHVPEDALAFLTSCSEPAWMSRYSEYGWLDLRAADQVVPCAPTDDQMRVLLAFNFAHDATGGTAGFAAPSAPSGPSVKQEPAESPESSKHVRQVIQQSQEAVPLLSASELEECLTRGSKYTPFRKQPCDVGQVMRGLVAVWAHRLATVDACNEKRARLLRLQSHAGVVFCVIYSANHWCLLVLRKPANHPPAAHLYDGICDRVCEDAARAFLLHVNSCAWAPQLMQLTCARTSPQNDAWSCGHRAVITADLVLAHLSDHGVLPASLDGPSNDDVAALIRRAARCEQIKQEKMCPPVKCKREPANQHAVPPVPTQHTQPREEHEDGMDRSPRAPGRSAKNTFQSRVGESSDELSPPPVARTIRRAPRQGAVKKSSAQDAQASGKGKMSTPNKLSKQTVTEAATCLDKGVTHTTFQKPHVADENIAESGHWHVFLQATDILTCRTCERLLRKVKGEDEGEMQGQMWLWILWVMQLKLECRASNRRIMRQRDGRRISSYATIARMCTHGHCKATQNQ